LEALAVGIPIVSTSKGVEGLDLIDQKDYLLASNPKEFAQKIELVLENKKLRKRLIINGKKAINSKYSLKIMEENLKSFLDHIGI